MWETETALELEESRIGLSNGQDMHLFWNINIRRNGLTSNEA